MKTKFYLLVMTLAMFVVSATTFAQGLENFDNFTGVTSYSDGSFDGADAITWTYVESRDENGDANSSGIDGSAMMLRRDTEPSTVTSGVISGGIGDFSIKLYKGFTGGGDRQIEVFVNDVSVGTSVAFDDFDEHIYSITGVNVSGDITIKIENITPKQIIIDDIEWTAYSGGTPTPNVTIVSPQENDDIASSDLTVEFTTQNFVVADAGNGDGHIHYYVDGAMTMYYSPDPIELTGLTEGAHEVILKLVDDAHADLVPSIADTVNFTVTLPTDVADIAALRAGTEGEFYRLTGEAFVTYAQSYRSQKYIQDATGAILIDDDPGAIATEYVIGDGMTNLVGELSSFNGVMQFLPLSDPGDPSSTGNVTDAQLVELSEFNTNFEDYESELVMFDAISFVDAGLTFENGNNYDIMQGAESGTFRSHFYNVDYIGTTIPNGANVTGIAMEYNGSYQFASRFLTDIEEVVLVPENDNCDGAVVTDLEIGTDVTVSGNGDGATVGDFLTYAQVWEAFTTTECATVTLDFCGSDLQAVALYGSLYDCPTTGAVFDGDIFLFGCEGDSALGVVFQDLPAGTYYYPVIADTASFGGFHAYDLNMSAVACDPPPVVEGESFESGIFAPECWTQIDADGDGNVWFSYAADPYAGDTSAASASWFGGSPLTPDNYLVTPQLVLGDDEVLSYHVAGQDPDWSLENYGVWISTTGNEEADFTTELFVETLTGTTWEERIVDLSDYNGMTVYLAFRHYDVTDQFYMKIDNVILPGTIVNCADAIDEIANADFSVYPNPNNGEFSIVNNGVNGTYIIEMMDVTGKVVYSEQMQLNANQRTEINASNVNTGVYLVKMTNTDENYFRTIRMVIK